MKRLITVMLVLLGGYGCLAQTADCNKFRLGKFKMNFNGFTLFIERKGALQTEEFTTPDKKISVSYKVTWITDCQYTLKPLQDFYNQFPGTPNDALITVNITGTTKNAYTLTSFCNFNDKVFNDEIIKIN